MRRHRTAEEIRTEALERATSGGSVANYPAVFEGFAAKGIPLDDIRPRENILTYQAWRARGRQVRRGEHGVRLAVFVETQEEDGPGGEPGTVHRRPWHTTVFHESQTEEAAGR